MTRLIHPFFGDLFLGGIASLGWLLVLALIWDAWWEKKRARARCEPPRKQSATRAGRRTRAFFRRFRWAFAVLAVVPIVAVMLLRGRENDSSDTNGMLDYATNFQGDATCPAPVAKTLNLAVSDTNLFGANDSTQLDEPILTFETLPGPRVARILTYNENASAHASPSGNRPVARGGIGSDQRH